MTVQTSEGPKGIEVLKALGELTEEAFGDVPSSAHRVGEKLGEKNGLRAGARLTRLRNAGLVKRSPLGYSLTQKGRQALEGYVLSQTPPVTPIAEHVRDPLTRMALR